MPYSSFQSYETPILENSNNLRSSKSDLMWQTKAIGENIITTQVWRNFFIAHKELSQFGQKHKHGVFLLSAFLSRKLKSFTNISSHICKGGAKCYFHSLGKGKGW
jgi:hypothetical protein